ncbi:hypothetical protein EIP86_000034 [Pleurotus ostreatoroseus]|nr:hypothetical protein EIP86_000034 [Pleurotus ostreatoroseus]
MLSLFRLVSFAVLALPLFQLVDAHAIKRAPVVGSNGDRLAKRLPQPRPKRLFSSYGAIWHSYQHLCTFDFFRLGSVLVLLVGICLAIFNPFSVFNAVSASFILIRGPVFHRVRTSSTTPAPVATRTGYISLEKINTATPMRKRDTFPGYIGSYGMVPKPPGSSGQTAFVYTYTVPSSASIPVQFNVDMDPVRMYLDSLSTSCDKLHL